MPKYFRRRDNGKNTKLCTDVDINIDLKVGHDKEGILAFIIC
jgi:hypothetical protein